MEEHISAWERKYRTSERVWGGYFSADEMTRAFPHNARLLDAGSGNGKALVPLAKAGFDVVGLDISQSANKKLNATLTDMHVNDVSILTGDVRALPFCDCTFDCVAAYHVICHMYASDRMRALREFERVLKHEGMLSIESFSVNDFRFCKTMHNDRMHTNEANTIIKGDGILYHYYNESEFKEELAASGFSIEKFEVVQNSIRSGKERHMHESLFAIVRKPSAKAIM